MVYADPYPEPLHPVLIVAKITKIAAQPQPDVLHSFRWGSPEVEFCH